MSKYDSEKHSSFALIPAFGAGIEDSINPCGIAAVLVFILYLSFVGYTKKRIFLLGVLFILSAVVAHFVLVMGAFDHMLTHANVLNAIYALYVLLIVAFLAIGILSILDWWQYKKYSDVERFKLKLPAFLNGDCKTCQVAGKMGKILKVIGDVFLAVLAGGIITLMGTLYPQNEYMFVVHSFFMARNDYSFAARSFFLYSIAVVLPLVMVWIVVFWLALMKGKGPKIILYYKGISSALFLATGIGLGFFIFKLII